MGRMVTRKEKTETPKVDDNLALLPLFQRERERQRQRQRQRETDRQTDRESSSRIFRHLQRHPSHISYSLRLRLQNDTVLVLGPVIVFIYQCKQNNFLRIQMFQILRLQAQQLFRVQTTVS